MEASTVNEEAAYSLIDSKRIKPRRSGAYLNFWENGGNNAGEAGRDRSWRRATAVLTDGPRTAARSPVASCTNEAALKERSASHSNREAMEWKVYVS